MEESPYLIDSFQDRPKYACLFSRSCSRRRISHGQMNVDSPLKIWKISCIPATTDKIEGRNSVSLLGNFNESSQFGTCPRKWKLNSMSDLLYQQGASQCWSEIFKSGENNLRSNYIIATTFPVLSSIPHRCLDRPAVEGNPASTWYIRSNDKVGNKAWWIWYTISLTAINEGASFDRLHRRMYNNIW